MLRRPAFYIYPSALTGQERADRLIRAFGSGKKKGRAIAGSAFQTFSS